MPTIHDKEWVVELIKEAEGQGGFDGEYFHPYKSPEGGKPTIGYGHKIVEDVVSLDGEEINLMTTPLTEEQAVALLLKDIQKAELKARRDYTQHNNPAGKKWTELNELEQTIYTEIAYNVGRLTDRDGKWGWPKLAKAMKAGDTKAMLAEIDRKYQKEGSEEFTVDKRRNTLLRKAYKKQLKENPAKAENPASKLVNLLQSEPMKKLSDEERAKFFVELYRRTQQKPKPVEEEVSITLDSQGEQTEEQEEGAK